MFENYWKFTICGKHANVFVCVYFFCSWLYFQVLGADILQTKEPTKTFDLLRYHIQAVRDTYEMLNCSTVHIIVERNLGFEAEHLFRECRDTIENCLFIGEPLCDRIGVLTTQQLKLAFVTYSNIIMRENRMFVSKSDLFVDVGKRKTRNVLFDQLSFFGFTFSRPDNQFQKEKYAISGKSSGGKDDLCMALLIGMYFCIDGRYDLR